MAYTPTKVITIKNRTQLSESTDLTPVLSSFIATDSYLVVTQNTVVHTLSLGKILTFVPGLALTQPISTALSTLISDAFIARFGVTGIPSLNASGFYPNRLAVFNPGDIQEKEFTVHYTSVNTPDVVDIPSQRGYLDDLSISVNDYDLSNCLVAVNGVFHKTVILNNILFVLDGFRTIRLSAGRRDITIVDTKKLGGHTVIPLTSSNVMQSDYQEPALVTLEQSVTGNTLFAVIDGYFYHMNHNVIQYADAMHLKLLTNKMPLIEQFRHNPRTVYRPDRYGPDATQNSRKYSDNFDSLFLNNRAIPTATLESAAFQYSRLTSFHSFLVIMNNPDIFTMSFDAVPTGTLQFYEDLSNRVVSGMLSYSCGLCPSYLIKRDPYDRKSIYLSIQDNDTDWQSTNADPAFIPALVTEPHRSATLPLKFIDYFTA